MYLKKNLCFLNLSTKVYQALSVYTALLRALCTFSLPKRAYSLAGKKPAHPWLCQQRVIASIVSCDEWETHGSCRTSQEGESSMSGPFRWAPGGGIDQQTFCKGPNSKHRLHGHTVSVATAQLCLCSGSGCIPIKHNRQPTGFGLQTLVCWHLGNNNELKTDLGIVKVFFGIG